MTASGVLNVVEQDHELTIIDEAHLERMTLGDRRLEREVLEIFARQTIVMLTRIAAAEPAIAAAAAHTLLGSARGIGAWRLARAAECLERAAGSGRGDRAIIKAIEELSAAAIEAHEAIDARLRERPDDASRDH